MSAFGTVKLHYFNVPGAAQVSRIMLHLGGVPFEDMNYTYTREKGVISGPEYDIAKANGTFRINMDTVPVLEVNGFFIGQSKSIERYIASKCGLFGANDEERGVIDCISENLRDMKDKYMKITLAPESSERTQQLEKWFIGGEMAEWLVKLEHSLPVNATGAVYVVGSSPSYADIVIWHFLRAYFTNKEGVHAAAQKAHCVRLSVIAEKVGELKAVKQSLATGDTSLIDKKERSLIK
jgi:glutathione S-transferase